MTAKKHLHVYRRVDIGKKVYNRTTRKMETPNPYIVYKCVLDGCTHYDKPELLEGREAQCPRCGNAFIVTQRMIGTEKLVNLRCEDCKQDKKAKATEEFLTELGIIE